MKVAKTILLLISHSCNLNCRYCYEWHKDNRKMSWPQVIGILEEEFSNTDEPVESVDLLGGEPFTNKSIIRQTSEWIWKHSPATHVFCRTNGTLLDNEMKQWCASNRERFTLGLSLDGIPQANMINRGTGSLDILYFLHHWPDNPIKMTLFPDSVRFLHESVVSLYSMGANVIASLAQGVKWDNTACLELERQLGMLTDFYLEHPEHTPLEPLYDLNFQKAFWIQPHDAKEDPCWKQANIHSYDCDGELLPCHMFSAIVQGKEKRDEALKAHKTVNEELMPHDCRICAVRWCCKNCMAMNYQHTGDFGQNINLSLMCEAQKLSADASARYILQKHMRSNGNIDSDQEFDKLSNALKYLKSRNKAL